MSGSKRVQERRVRDVVDLTLEALLRVVDRHAAELGAEVGVVVDAEKVSRTMSQLGYSAEEAALLLYSCMEVEDLSRGRMAS